MTETAPTPSQRVARAVLAGGTEAAAREHGAPYGSVRRANVVRKRRPDLFERVLAGGLSEKGAYDLMRKETDGGGDAGDVRPGRAGDAVARGAGAGGAGDPDRGPG